MYSKPIRSSHTAEIWIESDPTDYDMLQNVAACLEINTLGINETIETCMPRSDIEKAYKEIFRDAKIHSVLNLEDACTGNSLTIWCSHPQEYYCVSWQRQTYSMTDMELDRKISLDELMEIFRTLGVTGASLEDHD